MPEQNAGEKGWPPKPDPTVHTTEALRAGLAALKELLLARVEAVERTADERWARVEEQVQALKERGDESIAQLRRERELVTADQKTSIAKAEQATALALDKAEVATDKRFDTVNQFMERQSDAVGRFLPREVAEAQFAEVRRVIADLTEKVSKIA